MIATDLNDRERKRFAERAGSMAKAATELAEKLRVGDDDAAVVHLVVLPMSGPFINELGEILANCTQAVIPSSPPSPR